MLVGADGIGISTIIFSVHDVDAAAQARVDAVLVKARGSISDLKETSREVLHKAKRPA